MKFCLTKECLSWYCPDTHQVADWGLLMGELLGDAVVMQCGNVKCINLSGEWIDLRSIMGAD